MLFYNIEITAIPNLFKILYANGINLIAHILLFLYTNTQKYKFPSYLQLSPTLLFEKLLVFKMDSRNMILYYRVLITENIIPHNNTVH